MLYGSLYTWSVRLIILIPIKVGHKKSLLKRPLSSITVQRWLHKSQH